MYKKGTTFFLLKKYMSISSHLAFEKSPDFQIFIVFQVRYKRFEALHINTNFAQGSLHATVVGSAHSDVTGYTDLLDRDPAASLRLSTVENSYISHQGADALLKALRRSGVTRSRPGASVRSVASL